MFKTKLSTVALFALMVSSTGLINARDELEKSAATKTSKLERMPVAAATDFVGSLRLPFQSLTTIGARIDAARLAADPVVLSCLARELAVAEKVSGKKASLNAGELEKEALALVKLRNQSQELEAVGLLLDDEKVRVELGKLAETAKERESEAAEAIKRGELKKGLQGTLIVTNLHNVPMNLYTNGLFRGTVAPFQTNFFYVDNPPGFTSVFEVRYPDGSSRASWTLTDNLPSFHWTIDPTVP
jgi:hypothetical protein